jgi:hypothetical protein
MASSLNQDVQQGIPKYEYERIMAETGISEVYVTLYIDVEPGATPSDIAVYTVPDGKIFYLDAFHARKAGTSNLQMVVQDGTSSSDAEVMFSILCPATGGGLEVGGSGIYNFKYPWEVNRGIFLASTSQVANDNIYFYMWGRLVENKK